MGLLNWSRDGTIVGTTRNEIDIRCDAQGENWITVKGPKADDIADQVLSNRYASKERDDLREALLDAQPAVELLHEITEGQSDNCNGPDDINFELCGSGICDRIGCMKWKVDRVADTLANLNKTDGE